jgi:hypothetical protein
MLPDMPASWVRARVRGDGTCRMDGGPLNWQSPRSTDQVDQLELLAAQKTVTINRLLAELPEGTADPTPYICTSDPSARVVPDDTPYAWCTSEGVWYTCVVPDDTPMYVCAFLFTGAWATNAMLQPLGREKYYLRHIIILIGNLDWLRFTSTFWDTDTDTAVMEQVLGQDVTDTLLTIKDRTVAGGIDSGIMLSSLQRSDFHSYC